jgi:hypothetical protein
LSHLVAGRSGSVISWCRRYAGMRSVRFDSASRPHATTATPFCCGPERIRFSTMDRTTPVRGPTTATNPAGRPAGKAGVRSRTAEGR